MTGPTRAWAVPTSVVLLCLIWGSTWIVIQWGLEDLPPISAAAARMWVAAIAMSLVATRVQRIEGGERPPRWLAWVVGGLQMGYSYAVVYISETSLPSGLVSLLWSVFPLFMAISAHLFLPGERLVARQWLGFVFATAGMVLLFAKVLSGISAAAVPMGLFLLTSPLAATVANTLVKKHGAKVSATLLNRDSLWIAAVVLTLAALGLERERELVWSARAVVSVLHLALVGTAVAFGLYFWLMRSIAAHRMSLISYVNPAIGLFLGWLVAGEPMTREIWGGSALILVGILLVVRRQRRTTARATQEAA